MWWGIWCLLLALAAGTILAIIVLSIVRGAADSIAERSARNTRENEDVVPVAAVMRRATARTAAGDVWSTTSVKVHGGTPLGEVISVDGFPDVLARFDSGEVATSLATSGTAPVRLEGCTGPYAAAVYEGSLRVYAVGMGDGGCVRLHSTALDKNGAVANARHVDVRNVPFNGGQGIAAAGNKLILYTERDHGLFAYRVDGDGTLHDLQDGPIKLSGGRAARSCGAGPVYVAVLCADGDAVVYVWNGVRYRHAYDIEGPFSRARLDDSTLVVALADGSHRAYTLRDRDAVERELSVPDGAEVMHAAGPVSVGREGEVYLGDKEVARVPPGRVCCHDATRLAFVAGPREYHVLAH
jgi:hypothetical protein